MRARSKKLIFDEPLCQSNIANGEGVKWCGRTSAAAIYNYYQAVKTNGDKSTYVKNQYERAQFDLVYPSGDIAADGYDLSEPMRHFHASKWKGSWESLYPIDERHGTPSEDEIQKRLDKLLNVLDNNNPVLFASGLTNAKGGFASHFIVISGYTFDDEGALWLRINDPARNHTVVQSVLKDTYGVPAAQFEKYIKVESQGIWATPDQPKGVGAVYTIKAEVLFKSNPFMRGKTGWQGPTPPDPLFCDNQFHSGFGVLLDPELRIDESRYSITELDVSWPINVAAARDGSLDWTRWTDPSAPFPIGRNLVWHGGVHVHANAASDDNVCCVAPGRIVLVRFPKEPPPSDEPAISAGMVLVRHELDPQFRQVLKPLPDGTGECPEMSSQRDSALPFYSLYVHLAPISQLLDAGGYAASFTPRWVRTFAPEHPPEYRDFYPGTTPRTLSTWQDGQFDGQVAIPMVRATTVGADAVRTSAGGNVRVNELPTRNVSVGGASNVVIPDGAANAKQRDAWRALIHSPKLASQQPFHYYNPLTRKLVDFDNDRIPKGQALGTRVGSDGLTVVDVVATDQSGQVSYVRIDLHKHPGFRWDELKSAHIHHGVVSFPDGVSVDVMLAPTSGATPQHGATLSGPRYEMRFAVAEGLPIPMVLPSLLPCIKLDASEQQAALASARRGTGHLELRAGHPISLFNPLTEQLIDTSVQLATGAPIELTTHGKSLTYVAEANGGTYFLLAGTEVRFETSDAGAMVVSSQDCLHFDSDVSSVKLYLDTAHADDGRAADRFFPDESARTLGNAREQLVFPIRERRATTGRDRIWLNLIPIAQVATSDVRTFNSDLASTEQRRFIAVRDRLQAGLSCLYGVELTDKSGWDLQDGSITPAAAPADGSTRKIYLCQIESGDGGGLSFVRVKGDTDAAPFEVQGNQSFQLRPVHVIPNKAGNPVAAVLEVFVSVPTGALANNRAQINAINEENGNRRKTIDKFKKGNPEDVKDLQLFVGRESIGKMGSLVEESAADSNMSSVTDNIEIGAHVEIFSGTNLIDKDAAGTDHELAPVPSTNWMILRDDDAADAYTPGFVERVHEWIVTSDQLGLDYHRLGHHAVRTRVITPTEWQNFSQDNARAFSRVIAVHPSLWRPQLSDLLDQSHGRGQHLGDDRRSTISDAIEKLVFWNGGLQLDGMDPSRPVFHYHPLRLVEWLTTGLDLDTAAVDQPKIFARVETAPEVELVDSQTALHPIFRFRTVVGDRRPATRVQFRLDGFETAQPLLPVDVPRGGLRRVVVCKPRLEISELPFDATTLSLLVPVETTMAFGALYLLPDNDQVAPAVGYSHATVQAVSHFNLKCPTSITVALSNTTDFRVVKVDASGDAECNVNDALSTVTVRPKAGTTGLFERASQVTVQVQVVSASTDPGKETTVDFESSGGDLPSTARVSSSKITTREIKTRPKRGDPRMIGEDVAKLQLLLSQILAEDGQPCYRAGRGGEYGQPKVKKVYVDGDYGEQTARALWRFCYKWASDHDDARTGHVAWQAAQVRTTHANGSAGDTVPADKLKVPDEHKGERLAKGCPDFPIVDKDLLAEIVRRFKVPYVMPTAQITVPEDFPSQPVLRSIASNAQGWNKTEWGKSTILGFADGQVRASLTIPELGLIGSSIKVKLKLPGTSSYKIVYSDGEPSSEVPITVTGPVTFDLVFQSGNLDKSTSDNTLKVFYDASETELGSIVLGGARDLTKKQDKPGRDIALLQLYLSQLGLTEESNRTDSERCYRRRNKAGAAILDGRWTPELKQAIARFKEGRPAASTYEDLVSAVHDEFDALPVGIASPSTVP